MQFTKFDVDVDQSDVWWNTLKQLSGLNGWIDIDISAVVESHNDLVEIYEHS